MEEWEMDGSRGVLESIAMLLFSLAGLAELAAGLPVLRRRHVLGILSVGEAEAHTFLIGAGTPISAAEQDTARDALRLAARLRALALLLVLLLSRRFVIPGIAGPRADRGRPVGPAGGRATLSVPDTS
ncbi:MULTISPECIES: hypothetical protein [unclassified Mesorhizobium]|uniref:hypothetical protein n=1 Tax=unclassified Mesorhizobium TaxID=325217 RepID=UPI0006F2C897|nr:MULTISPECIES: hypothetical protein [unclassified Mesorhizobium]